MTTNVFYYTDQASNVVRVEAEDFDQITSSEPAQCLDEPYTVLWVWGFRQRNFTRMVTPSSVRNAYPPIRWDTRDGYQADAFGNVSPRPKARILYRQMVNGVLVEANDSYKSFSFANRGSPAYRGYLRFCRGGNNPPRLNGTVPSSGYGAHPSHAATQPNYDGTDLKCATGTLPDDCGGRCQTEFRTNGQVILTLDYCPDVSTQPPDSCADCCGDLLQLARTIRV
ncbi:MAG: hypothetical protein AB8B99_03035 [Phormidesmis sp.]